jgi:hypothetical protein
LSDPAVKVASLMRSTALRTCLRSCCSGNSRGLQLVLEIEITLGGSCASSPRTSG